MKLTLSALTIAFAAISAVNAHFEITFPTVRGPFVEDNEPQFCDGYTQVGNRSLFPLANGFLLWEGEHPSWTTGVMISTAAAPSSFNDFRNSSGTDQLAVGYFQGTGTSGCIRVNASAAGLGVQDGSNITLQMVYNGGDGVLYQCVDLTLSAQYTIPSNYSCSNAEGSPPSSTDSANPFATSTTSKSSSDRVISTVNGGLLGLSVVGMLAVVLA